MSYSATFGDDDGKFYSSILFWDPTDINQVIPLNVINTLFDSVDVNFSIRYSGDIYSPILLIISTRKHMLLQSVVTKIRDSDTTGTNISCTSNATEYDELSRLPPDSISVTSDHSGYHYESRKLACNYRLYYSWFGKGLSSGMSYQLTATRYQPTQSTMRATKKYRAWLNLEKPYTEPVRNMQLSLSERLMSAGWLVDEYLVFSAQEIFKSWKRDITDHFQSTVGLSGFKNPPFSVGDYEDALVSGHIPPSTNLDAVNSPDFSARLFSPTELLQIAKHQTIPNTGNPQTSAEVFISYSSKDFEIAYALCKEIEITGIRCWIAPRDINFGGLPYTEAIPKAIDTASAVIVLCSETAYTSVHIPREIDLSLNRKLTIIPIRLDEQEPTGQLRYLLSTCQWLQAQSREMTSIVQELEQRLRSVIENSTTAERAD